MRVTVRLFARQREIAGSREVALELPAPATIEDAWAALAELHPALAAGRPYVRFARNGEYADPTTPLVDGDQLACIPPVSGGAGDELGKRSPPGSWSSVRATACDSGRTLGDRAGDAGRRCRGRFEGRTRETPGAPAPGEEAEARRHDAGSASRRSSTRPSSRSRSACSRRSPAPSRPASGCTGLPSSTPPAACRWGRPPGHRRLRTPPGRGVRRRPLRDGRDEGTGADLEGRALRGRPRLDRSASTHQMTWGARRSGRRGMKVTSRWTWRGSPASASEADRAPRPGLRRSGRPHDGRGERCDRGRAGRRRDGVIVNDSHGSMYNLAREALHPAAWLIQGQKAWSMVEGAGPGRAVGVALFVGYHARAGDPMGTIAHTYSFAPTLTVLDGRPAGETAINARGPGGLGDPGRDGKRRRSVGPRGRGLASLGRAGDREAGSGPQRRRLPPPVTRPRARPTGRGTGRPARRRRGAAPARPPAAGGHRGDLPPPGRRRPRGHRSGCRAGRRRVGSPRRRRRRRGLPRLPGRDTPVRPRRVTTALLARGSRPSGRPRRHPAAPGWPSKGLCMKPESGLANGVAFRTSTGPRS